MRILPIDDSDMIERFLAVIQKYDIKPLFHIRIMTLPDGRVTSLNLDDDLRN